MQFPFISDALWSWVDVNAPIIYLDTHERYFPVDFNTYISRCDLVNTHTQRAFHGYDYNNDEHGGDELLNTPATTSSLNATILGQWLARYPHLTTVPHTLCVRSGMADPVINSTPTFDAPLNNVPLFAHVRSVPSASTETNTYMVTYAHSYAYNGALPICGGLFGSAGSHYADLEYVTLDVRVNAHNDSQRAIHRPRIASVYFSRHSGGMWIDNDTAQQDDAGNEPGSLASMDTLHGTQSVTHPVHPSCISKCLPPSMHCKTWCTSDDGSYVSDTRRRRRRDGAGGESLTWENGRLVVYSALNSHASYANAGSHPRFCGALKDECSKGHRWATTRVVHLHDDVYSLDADRRWTALYRGDMGDGQVASFRSHTFWSHTEHDSNYQQGCRI